MGGAALRTSTFPRSFARQSFAEDFRRAMAATRVRPCAREIFTTLEYGPVPESHACALVRACPAAAVYSLTQAHGPHLARGLPSSSATFSEAPPPPRVIPAAGLVDGLACRMPHAAVAFPQNPSGRGGQYGPVARAVLARPNTFPHRGSLETHGNAQNPKFVRTSFERLPLSEYPYVTPVNPQSPFSLVGFFYRFSYS